MAVENQWKHLEFTLALSKRLFSLLNLKTFALALLLTYWLLRTRKHKARIDVFVHATCYPETMPMSRIVKKPCSIFKTKRESTELKTLRPTDICL